VDEDALGAAGTLNQISEQLIACAIEVHRRLGPGLLESVYEAALAVELELAGLRYERQKPLSISYRDRVIGELRMDLLVEDTVVIEIKSVERMDPLFDAQLLSYLKLGGYRLGLLLNFNSVLLKRGIKRLVNDFPQS